MRALFITLLIALVSFVSAAESVPEELPPLDPAYVGIHGMVLMNQSSSIFAYHLPLYRKPHNVQLLYKLEVKSVALVQLIRDNDLVTIKPKPFNLQRLMRGEKMAIEADIYMGHFERDGMLVYENMTLNFAKKLYVRKLENAKPVKAKVLAGESLESKAVDVKVVDAKVTEDKSSELQPSSNQQVYDVVSYGKSDRIYIHRLQQAPSFDHLIHIDVDAGCLTTFRTSTAVPERTELQYKFLNCGTMKPLYYETEDFKKH
jgi:hypothetical protein